MENELNTQSVPPVPETAPAAANREKPAEKKKGGEEFSIAWHMKVLAVIYVILGILYIVLKFTLK